jgi:hypothetical protein
LNYSISRKRRGGMEERYQNGSEELVFSLERVSKSFQ